MEVGTLAVGPKDRLFPAQDRNHSPVVPLEGHQDRVLPMEFLLKDRERLDHSLDHLLEVTYPLIASSAILGTYNLFF